MRIALLFFASSLSLFAGACGRTPTDPCASGSAAGDPSCHPKQFCGGIAAIACPGAGVCVDDPSDGCDPTRGGADCGGLCECNALGSCVEGYEWDASPGVCGCVPTADACAAVRCQGGYHCESSHGQAQCIPNDVSACAAVLCEVGTECVVTNGQASCVPTAPIECGGTTCATGEYCCNASCGLCAPRGAVCIQIACE